MSKWLASLGLVAVGALIYANSLDNPFVYDDIDSIVENPHVRQLWPPSVVLSGPPGSSSSGRPLAALSLALNYAWGGLDVRGYHIFNIAVHVATALMLFSLLRLIGRCAGSGLGTQGLALAVALLWLVHPLHTAALNHVVYRNEMLMAFFFLSTLYAAGRSFESHGRKRAAWRWLAVICCASSLASKEVAVVLPVVVLLFDYTFVSTTMAEIVKRRWRFYAGLTSTWILAAYLVSIGDRGSSVGLDLEAVRPLDYARTQFGVVVHYLRLAIYPQPLVLDYRWPIETSWNRVVPEALVILGLLVASFWAVLKKREGGFWGAWAFLILTPTSTIIPLTGAVAAEHRMYLPLLAVIVVVVLLLQRMLRPWRGSIWTRVFATLLVAAIASIWSLQTRERNTDYESARSIWADTLEKRPHNEIAMKDLAAALAAEGHVQEAIARYRDAIRIRPTFYEAHSSLGSAWVQAGDLEQAERHFKEALRLNPEDHRTHTNLAALRTRQRRLDEATAHVQQALALRPDFGMAFYNWGHVLRADGKLEEAIQRWQQAARLMPHFPAVHDNLGTAYLRLAHYEAAKSHFQTSLAMKDDRVGTLNNLAWLLATAPDASVRDGQAALQYAEKAQQIGPLSVDILDTKAAALAELDRFDEAAAALQAALRMKPNAAQQEKLRQRLELYRRGTAYRMQHSP